MTMIRVEAKSIELALVKAAGQLGVTQGSLNHRILEEKKGWFGVWGNKVVLECWPKAQSRTTRKQSPGQKSKQPRTTREAEPLSEERLSQQGGELLEFCKGLCERISSDSVEVDLQVDQDRLILNVRGQTGFFEEQFTKNPRLVESLEHILRKKTISKGESSDSGIPVFLDAGRVRQSREAELMQMARDLSKKVFDSQEPLVLNYRNPYDRKIIHMALDHDDRVYTKSVGSGYNRKLMILPRSST